MARWGNCQFDQLKEYADKLEKLTDADINDLCVKCSRQLAARLLALVIPRTPVGNYPASSGKKGGTLRRGWTSSTYNRAQAANDSGDAAVKATTWAKNLRVHKSGNLYTIEIKNPVEYASYVEFGHRTKSGGWVDGKYMLTISEERLKQIAPRVLEKMLYQKIREVIEHG